MESLIGKWGGTNMYNAFDRGHLEFIHPDDHEKLKNYPFIRSLHQCIAVNGNFVTVTFGDNYQFRIDREIFNPLNAFPKFKPFEKSKK